MRSPRHSFGRSLLLPPALAFPALLVVSLLTSARPASALVLPPSTAVPPAVPLVNAANSADALGVQHPDISYNKARHQYLVVWEEPVNPTPVDPTAMQRDIWYQIFEEDGTPVPGSLFQIAPRPDGEPDPWENQWDQYSPCVASTDSNDGTAPGWVVAYAWQHPGPSSDWQYTVSAWRVDVGQPPELIDTVTVSNNAINRVDIGAAPGLDRYLVVWDEKDTTVDPPATVIQGRRIRTDTDPIALDGNVFSISPETDSDVSTPAVNQRGSMFLVAWERGTDYAICGRTVEPVTGVLGDPIGNPADPDGASIYHSPEGRTNVTPAVAADDGSTDLVHFLVAWTHQSALGFRDTDIWGAFVTHDVGAVDLDTVLPGQDIIASGFWEETPAVAYTGVTDTFMVACAAADPNTDPDPNDKIDMAKRYLRAARFVRRLMQDRGVKGVWEQVSVDADPNIDEQHPAVTPLYPDSLYGYYSGVAVVWDRQTWIPVPPQLAPAPEPTLWARYWYQGDSNVGRYDASLLLPLAGLFELRNTNITGDADKSFFFGPAPTAWAPIAGNWDGDVTDVTHPKNGKATVGLHRRDEGKFYLRNSNDAGPADVVVRYGTAPSSAIALAGNWDGLKAEAGVNESGDTVYKDWDTIGLYDQGNGVFELRNSNAPGAADVTFRFGPEKSDWLPVAGDWDDSGDAINHKDFDTVGLYDPVNGVFYLRNHNSPGPADIPPFRFGPELSPRHWLPIAGDWNDDGKDTIGLYDPVSGTFYLKNSNSAGPADLTFHFGPAFGSSSANWLPIAGDWDGDRRDSVGLYDPYHARFYLKQETTPGAADLTFLFGTPPHAALPTAGDWNRDGADSVGLYRQDLGRFYLSYFNRAGLPDVVFPFGPPLGSAVTDQTWFPIAGDWNGDGAGTIGLYNRLAGLFYLRNSNTGGTADITFRYGPTGMQWLPIAGNWNGLRDEAIKANCDTIGLYNQATGTFYLKNSNSPGPADLTFRFGPTGKLWLPIAGDWDRDGIDTVGLYDPVTNTYYLRNSNTPGPADVALVLGPPPLDPDAPELLLKPVAGDWNGV